MKNKKRNDKRNENFEKEIEATGETSKKNKKF